jgi:predicted DNA-binding transcriptional regulator AlpA
MTCVCDGFVGKKQHKSDLRNEVEESEEHHADSHFRPLRHRLEMTTQRYPIDRKTSFYLTFLEPFMHRNSQADRTPPRSSKPSSTQSTRAASTPSQDLASTQQPSHFTQRELAKRWHKSEATIERYRSDGVGPKFLKIGGAVRYRLEDIEAFEQECLYSSSQSRCAAARSNQASTSMRGVSA